MIKIGVTGSIASGKTTVARMLSGRKYLLFDADKEVKKIYKKRFFKNKILKKLGTNNKNEIFGEEIINLLLRSSGYTKVGLDWIKI